MDSLRSPATYISVATATALVGTSVYFNKRITTLTNELEKLTENLKLITKKVGESQIHGQQIQQIAQTVRQMADVMKKFDQNQQHLTDYLNYQDAAILSLSKSIESLGGTVNLPPNPSTKNVSKPQNTNRSRLGSLSGNEDDDNDSGWASDRTSDRSFSGYNNGRNNSRVDMPRGNISKGNNTRGDNSRSDTSRSDTSRGGNSRDSNLRDINLRDSNSRGNSRGGGISTRVNTPRAARSRSSDYDEDEEDDYDQRDDEDTEEDDDGLSSHIEALKSARQKPSKNQQSPSNSLSDLGL